MCIYGDSKPFVVNWIAKWMTSINLIQRKRFVIKNDSMIISTSVKIAECTYVRDSIRLKQEWKLNSNENLSLQGTVTPDSFIYAAMDTTQTKVEETPYTLS